jgi:formylglycine-generating enzyme required for sulfatase activity
MKALVAISLLLAARTGFAQERGVILNPREDSGKRFALVIGNQRYSDAPLRNAVNDSTSMAAALRSVGFEVQAARDADRKTMNHAVEAFVAALHSGDTALLYYAGHAIQVEGQNYLVPIGFSAESALDATQEALSLDRILQMIDAKSVRTKIIILDACRNNPYLNQRGGGGGALAPMQSARGSFIAFATSPGGTASDNPNGSNGLFTSHLLEVMHEPGVSIDEAFTEVRLRVSEDSRNAQLPWVSSSLLGSFCFQGPCGVAAPSVGLGTLAGALPGEARVNPRDGLEYVWVNGGETRVPCDPAEECGDAGVKPAKVEGGVWLMKRAVTEKAFARFATEMHVTTAPGAADKPDESQTGVGWETASRYCLWASGELPSEALWQYAIDAGRDEHGGVVKNRFSLELLDAQHWEWLATEGSARNGETGFSTQGPDGRAVRLFPAGGNEITSFRCGIRGAESK